MSECEYINQFNDFVIDTFLSSDKLNANDYVLLCIDTNFISSYIKTYGQSSWDTMIDYLSRNYENVIEYYCDDYIKEPSKYPGFLWIIAIHIYAAYKIKKKGYYHSLTKLLKGDDEYQKYLEKKLPEYTKLLWLTCYKDYLNRHSYKYFLGPERLSQSYFAVWFPKSQLYLNNDDMKMLTNFVHNNIDKLNSNTYTDYIAYMPQSLANKITKIKDKMFDDYINSFINVLKEDKNNNSKTPVTPTKPNNTVYNAKSTLYITACNDKISFMRNNNDITYTEVFQKQTYRLLEKDTQYDDTWIILDINSKFKEIDEIELYNNTYAICYIGDKAPKEFDIIEQPTITDKDKNISMYILSKDDIEILDNDLFDYKEFKLSGGISVGYRKWLYGAGPIIDFLGQDYINNIEINDNNLVIRKDYFVNQKPGKYELSINNKIVRFEIVSFNMQDKYESYNNIGWKVNINEFPSIVEENWVIQGLNINIDKQQKKEKNKIHQYVLEKFGLKYVRE